MNILRQKLLTLAARYGLQPTLQKVAELGIAFVILSGTVTTVVVVAPTHNKPTPPKATVAVAVKKPVAKPTSKGPSKPSSTTTPTPTATAPAPQHKAAPAPASPAPRPVPASQPSPGSAVKQLVTTPAPSPSTPQTTTPSSTPTSTGTPAPSTPALATGGYYSTNWSGYASMSGTFTSVSGSWVVPKVTGDGTNTTADAAWIGIGGVSSNDLIQTGTVNTVNPSGTTSTFAFYELLPGAALEIPSLTVSTGDVMSASISESSNGQWLISITDTTTNQNYSTTVSYASTHSSVEWVEEDPSYQNGSLVPFNHFGHVSFSAGSTTKDGVTKTLTALSPSPITLVDHSNTPIVTPSVLLPSTDGFWAIHN